MAFDIEVTLVDVSLFEFSANEQTICHTFIWTNVCVITVPHHWHEYDYLHCSWSSSPHDGCFHFQMYAKARVTVDLAFHVQFCDAWYFSLHLTALHMNLASATAVLPTSIQWTPSVTKITQGFALNTVVCITSMSPAIPCLYALYVFLTFLMHLFVLDLSDWNESRFEKSIGEINFQGGNWRSITGNWCLWNNDGGVCVATGHIPEFDLDNAKFENVRPVET